MTEKRNEIETEPDGAVRNECNAGISSNTDNESGNESKDNHDINTFLDDKSKISDDVVTNLSADAVYDYYRETLFPALTASFPILMNRLFQDSKVGLKLLLYRVIGFLIPGMHYNTLDLTQAADDGDNESPTTLRKLWEQTVASSKASNNATGIADFLLGHFDTNGDGHINSSELLNLGEIMKKWDVMMQRQNDLQHSIHEYSSNISWWAWFSREWPLMDWKIGLFIWRTFGGLIVLLAILSIIPGRLHGISARILRWPILALTYFLIVVELAVYVIIRLFIRLVEFLVAKPKHRRLRRCMAKANNYEEWYQYASVLDQSKKRDLWQKQIQDETSCTYNWPYIRELMMDMRHAREKDDPLFALAILQQCTRKNVGGIMSEDLFSYTHTGEPKEIVRQFIQEVVTTLRWMTHKTLDEDKARNSNIQNNGNKKTNTDSNNKQNINKNRISAVKRSYEQNLERQVRLEKDKMWKSLMSWATLSFGGGPGGTATINSQAIAIAEHLQSEKESQMKKDNIIDSKSENDKETIRERDRQTELLLDMDANTTGTDGSESLATRSSCDSTTDGGEVQLPQSIHKQHFIDLLKRARAAYGRTALCLSGGAMMGLYHFGHIVGLLECGLLPHIVSGTSAGSVVGAILCTRTDEELRRDFKPEILIEKLCCFKRPWKERLQSLVKNGHLFDFNDWLTLIKWFSCGDMTFEEAYKKTGRIFCITLSATTKKAPPVLLNYLSAPNITIASAVVASAAVPGFIPPARLQYKDPVDNKIKLQGDKNQTYFDGSIETDIPLNGLAEMLNVQFFVACQCNPHVVPFFYNSKGGVGDPSRWSSDRQENAWRGGFLLSALELYLKNDMRAKFVFLKDLEAAVGFTSTMMTQTFLGSTTITPQVLLSDFFKLFTDPDLPYLENCFQAGSVAAYQHCAMIKLHYTIADEIEECLAKLEGRNWLNKRAKLVLKPQKSEHDDNSALGSSLNSDLRLSRSGSTKSVILDDYNSDSLLGSRDPILHNTVDVCASMDTSGTSGPTIRKSSNSSDTDTTTSIGESADVYERNWMNEHAFPAYHQPSLATAHMRKPHMA